VRILLTAAERSGDLLAGPMLAALRARVPGLHATGIAGTAMRAAGIDRELGDTESLGGHGVVELLPRLPALLRAAGGLRGALRSSPRPDLAVFVDAPDLHLPIARSARALGIPTALLVCPQVWAWRPQRIETVRESADRVLCLFPFEEALLQRYGVPACFVGHPATDRPPRAGGPGRVLALMPGSRPGTRMRLLPLMLDVGCGVARTFGLDARLSWTGPPPDGLPGGVVLDRRPGWELLAESDGALVAAGTASLEAALLGVPQVVVARVHPWTFRFVGGLRRAPTVALPNVLLGPGACAEHVQCLDPATITRDLEGALSDSGRARARDCATRLRALLPSGYADRAAEALLGIAC
jgi:lipid-A-disaccharide synthase